jgi:hypothetical protein
MSDEVDQVMRFCDQGCLNDEVALNDKVREKFF